MINVAVNPFCRRQTLESPFTHWNFSEYELIQRVTDRWDLRQEGYRDGVILVPINPEGVFTSITTLKNGDSLKGVYRSRTAGEDPRKQIVTAAGVKQPAVRCDVVLYRQDVLAEDGELSPYLWNIITVLGYPTDEQSPMDPDTLMANHFHISGGTATKMTDAEFVAALKKSFLYWKDKALVG